MKVKYQITVGQKFFDNWKRDIEAWGASVDVNKDTKLIINLVEEFLQKAEINKIVVSKYNDFQEEIYTRYISYVKNQIYKILPLAEEKGEWQKHLDTLIVELTGSDKVFLHSVSFVSLINKLETLKDYELSDSTLSLEEIKKTEEFKLFRKTIFECMNIADMLSPGSDKNE